MEENVRCLSEDRKNNLQIIRILEGEEKGRGKERVVGKIIAKNFLTLRFKRQKGTKQTRPKQNNTKDSNQISKNK